MTDAYLGEIGLFPYGRSIKGWLPCDGRSLNIKQNTALFSLLGVYFGGDGTTVFNLPDLRGRVPVGEGYLSDDQGRVIGANYVYGQKGGVETVTVAANQVPVHTHAVTADATNGVNLTGNANYLAQSVYKSSTGTVTAENLYIPSANAGTLVPLAPGVVSTAGGGQGHSNMQPYLVVDYYICVSGYYPQRS